jgi:D-alanine-D-alanine ligase
MANEEKTSVILLFGGRSGEHEVSIASARSVASALDSSRYRVVPVYVDKSGVWRIGEEMILGSDKCEGPVRILSADPSVRHLLTADGKNAERIDVVLPVMHGTFGEDGCVQGLLELAGVPYVGSGVIGSAVGMDKVIQKILLQQAGVPVVDHVWFRRIDWENDSEGVMEKISEETSFPCFVKPANLGSSVGISKVVSAAGVRDAIHEALKYDEKIIIEKAVLDPREIECAVIGNDEPEVSVFGEIIPDGEFYDYSAKYLRAGSKLIIPADLPHGKAEEMGVVALQSFRLLEASGLARVDFLVESSGRYYLNEINTMPGFTAHSMFPKLWGASGLSYSDLLDRLIVLALEKTESKARLQREFNNSTA